MVTNNNRVVKLFSEGQEAKSGNMFVDGDTLYSYGYHFPVAKKSSITGIDYFFNPLTYSVTTSKHQSITEEKLKGTILYLLNCDLKNVRKQYEKNSEEIDIRSEKLPRCRTEKSQTKMSREISFLLKQQRIIEEKIFPLLINNQL